MSPQWKFSFFYVIFSIRKRTSVQLTSDETTRRLMLNRDWAKCKHQQHQQAITLIFRAFKSQENALEQLKIESEEPYDQALQVKQNCYQDMITHILKEFDY